MELVGSHWASTSSRSSARTNLSGLAKIRSLKQKPIYMLETPNADSATTAIICQMETMDDQQITDTQLAWLAGIWDGEGSFCIIHTGMNNSKKGKNHHILARISMSNTNLLIINKVAEIFKKLGCNFYISQPVRKNRPYHKDNYHFSISRMTHVVIACKAMLPYLIAKKRQAEILIEFNQSRLSKGLLPAHDENGKMLGRRYKPYDEKEVDFYLEISKLNRVGKEGREDWDKRKKEIWNQESQRLHDGGDSKITVIQDKVRASL
jgi:hypothetical protein